MKFADLLVEAEKRGLKLVKKGDSRLMRVCAVLVWPVNRRFMEDYITILGMTVYIPDSMWGRDGFFTIDDLGHEGQHGSDMQKYHVWFFFSYLFVNLFIVVGPGMRAFWEWRGYKHNIRAMARRGLPLQYVISYVVPQFVFQHYGWMGGFPCWPFKTFWIWMVTKEYRAARPSGGDWTPQIKLH